MSFPDLPPQHDPFVSVDYSMGGDPSKNRYRGEFPKGKRFGRRKVVLVLIGVLVVSLGTAAVVWAVNRGEPESVGGVAAAALDSGENFDVDAGIELFCETPTEEQREDIEAVIADAKRRDKTDSPARFTVTNVKGDKAGSFRFTISTFDEGLLYTHHVAQISVEQDGDRSCISDVVVLVNPEPYRPLGLP